MLTLAEIINAAAGRRRGPAGGPRVRGVSTDSRTISAGELFVAVRGEKFDGHCFLLQAAQRGAAAALLEESWEEKNRVRLKNPPLPLVLVKDTVAALGRIARVHRQKFRIPVIAVTGSNGKTTTKEMIALLLGARCKVLKSRDSFNNHIGVPLSLLQLKSEHQAAVLELGMNHAGEIRYLKDIVRPTIAVITNAAEAHLEFFRDVGEIARAKCELLENFPENNPAVVNADCGILYETAKKYRKNLTGFGIEAPCACRAGNITVKNNGTAFTLAQGGEFYVPAAGTHNVYNALAAIAAAEQAGVPRAEMPARLRDFRSPALRMQEIDYEGIRVIADCYNANPGSMRAAISAFSRMECRGRKIIVFADMLELGEKSRFCHEGIGRMAAQSGIDTFISVGRMAEFAAYAAEAAGMNQSRVIRCADALEARAILSSGIRAGDLILVKGSRRMRLEQIIDSLEKNPPPRI